MDYKQMAGAVLFMVAAVCAAPAMAKDVLLTRKQCVEKHVTKAKSEAAARLLGIACDELFRDYDFKMYMNEQGKRKGKSFTREELTNYAVTRGIVSREEASRRHEKIFRERERTRMMKATCTLNLKELPRARTDEAAREIFRASDCLED